MENLLQNANNLFNGLEGRYSKFKGDTLCRMLISKVEQLLRDNHRKYKAVGPNAFIRTPNQIFPTEFDILVVKENAIPLGDTNCYDAADVKIIIESKTNGLYYKIAEYEAKIERFATMYNPILEVNGNISCIYFTLRERCCGRGFLYAQRTAEELNRRNFHSYCLSCSNNVHFECPERFPEDAGSQFEKKILEITKN